MEKNLVIEHSRWERSTGESTLVHEGEDGWSEVGDWTSRGRFWCLCGGLALGAEAVPSEWLKAVPGTEPGARGRFLLIASHYAVRWFKVIT